MLSVLAVCVLLAGLVVVGSGAQGEPGPTSSRLGETTYPLIEFRGAADPTVALVGDQWVAISTGPSAPRAVAPSLSGPWTDAGNALTTLPPWATASRIWGSDLVRTDTEWLLYFSAPVSGLGSDGRCIGVATAASPLDDFVPQSRPLICPRKAVADPAYDIARPAKKGLPKRTGVIDPEGFQDRDGKRYVLYRTQSRPSTIRIVQVPKGGKATVRQQPSVELVRRGGVLENPVLVHRGKHWVMFTSQSYFGGCGYETTWRKASRLSGLAGAKKHVLLDQATTGLCGPGGADLTGTSLLFFHAWTCPELGTSCPSGNDYDKNPVYSAHRAMFGANLVWSKRDQPSIASFIAPSSDPYAMPTASPTPSPSASPSIGFP